ncbi:hypothetical protein CsSME_00048466 [Camellia sinensis var. sinensis]
MINMQKGPKKCNIRHKMRASSAVQHVYTAASAWSDSAVHLLALNVKPPPFLRHIYDLIILSSSSSSILISKQLQTQTLFLSVCVSLNLKNLQIKNGFDKLSDEFGGTTSKLGDVSSCMASLDFHQRL